MTTRSRPRSPQVHQSLRYGPYEVFFQEVDPTTARKFLEANTRNRNLKPKYKAFARDMASGDWLFNGDTIAFGEDGSMINGQHRLNAIIESNTVQLCLIVTGLPVITQDTMDQGTKRSPGDQLHMDGHENSMALAATVGLLVSFTQGLPWARSQAPTLSEVKHFIDEHPDVKRAVEVGLRAKKRVPAAPSALSAAYWLCAQVNKYDADHFFEDKLINRLGFTEGDPALALLNRYERIRDHGIRINADEVVRFALLAWNHFRAGSAISKLQSPKGGWTKDNFPHPQ